MVLPIRRFIKVLGLACTLVACAGTGSTELGVDDRRVLLGQTLPFSGKLGGLARQHHAGARLYFDALNATGGIYGRRIEFVTLDHGRDPQRALANTRALIYEHRVFALFGYLGKDIAATHHGIVQAERLPLLVLGPQSAGGLPRTYQRYFFQLSPVTADSHSRSHSEFVAALAAHDATAIPDPQQFSGYLAARVMAEALKRCGRDLSREKLVAALETIERDGLSSQAIAFAPSHQDAPSPTPDELLAMRSLITR